uniref:Secreted protein n=1 Tax=Octopus bimaculoides TaxID=37653 RepID=A0A0L8GHS8_OCTBM
MYRIVWLSLLGFAYIQQYRCWRSPDQTQNLHLNQINPRFYRENTLFKRANKVHSLPENSIPRRIPRQSGNAYCNLICSYCLNRHIILSCVHYCDPSRNEYVMCLTFYTEAMRQQSSS